MHYTTTDEVYDYQKGHYQSFAPVCRMTWLLNEAGIPTNISYCGGICDKVFNAPQGNKGNKHNKLLTEANKAIFFKKSPTLCTSKVEDGPF